MGAPSPLAPIEDKMVATMIRLARIRQPVTPTVAITLANSMIKDTPVQEALIEWKKNTNSKQDPELWGTVGRKFWYNSNFEQMYDEVVKEMVIAKVAVEFPTPVWMDREGNIVDEKSSFGCKVTHDITKPHCCFALDELGGNTSQKGDGHVGGQLLVCGKGDTPQISISTKSKHYTVMGITAFNGEIVMCVIIFAGLKPNALYETGFDGSASLMGKKSHVIVIGVRTDP